jgi:hypothetical protein
MIFQGFLQPSTEVIGAIESHEAFLWWEIYWITVKSIAMSVMRSISNCVSSRDEVQGKGFMKEPDPLNFKGSSV